MGLTEFMYIRVVWIYLAKKNLDKVQAKELHNRLQTGGNFSISSAITVC